MRDFGCLIEAVQHNCNVADARHAREATLCTYLLQMRELFRWEHEMPLSAQPPREELSRWLTEREEQWSTIADGRYEPLPLEGRRYDAFEAPALNRALLGRGLVYGAGYGRFHRPHFFLAELERSERRGGVDVLVCGCEFARDAAGAPAALQRDTVYVRRDALRRWLWEKIELWQARRGQGALQRALEGWNFAADAEAAFERMVEAETETAILHELGEARAAEMLGPAWEEMLEALQDRRAELLARAVRDHLADCLSTLPALLGRDAQASIHFYFSQLDGMRRELFPALVAAYGAWCSTGGAEPLRSAIRDGARHWEHTARELPSGGIRAGLGDTAALSI